MRQRFFSYSLLFLYYFFNFPFLPVPFLVLHPFCLFCIRYGGGPRSFPANRAVVCIVHISLRTNENTTATAKRKRCVGLNVNEILKRINDVKFKQLSVGFP
jgi:hypothetical protein